MARSIFLEDGQVRNAVLADYNPRHWMIDLQIIEVPRPMQKRNHAYASREMINLE